VQVLCAAATTGGSATEERFRRDIPTATATAAAAAAAAATARVPAGWPEVLYRRTGTEFRDFRKVHVPNRSAVVTYTDTPDSTGTSDAVQQQHSAIAATARRGWITTVQPQRAGAMGFRDKRQ